MRRLGFVYAVSVFAFGVAALGLPNGDFSGGGLHWKAAWHVGFADGEADLADAQADHAFIFQADSPGAGVFTVEFDFFNGLSPDVPRGTFSDSFYASLYYVDELSDFITEHDKFDVSQGMMDSDANGNFNVNGSTTASSKGAGWSHFSGTFTNSHAYVVVTFELYSLNHTPGDSLVRIDNVTITTGGAP